MEAFADAVRSQGFEFFPMMAAIAHGTDALIKRCAELYPSYLLLEYTPNRRRPDSESLGDRSVNITRRDDGAFVVEGEWLLRFLRGVNMDDYDSLQYFQRILQKSGVIDALRNAGVGDGDTVSIYDFEFDFIE